MAQDLFKDTGISITTEGRRLLVAALGEEMFFNEYLQSLAERLSTYLNARQNCCFLPTGCLYCTN